MFYTDTAAGVAISIFSIENTLFVAVATTFYKDHENFSFTDIAPIEGNNTSGKYFSQQFHNFRNLFVIT